MKAIDYKEMGLRIRKQRKLLGYSREQLAEALDVSTKFCADIELGLMKPQGFWAFRWVR